MNRDKLKPQNAIISYKKREMMSYIFKNKRIIVSLVFFIIFTFQFRDIIFSDYKILLFIALLFVMFGIIYYFSFTIFNKKDKSFFDE